MMLQLKTTNINPKRIVVFEDKYLEIAYRKTLNGYTPVFQVGNQTFSLREQGTLSEAKFCCDMLKKAFETLKFTK